MVLKNLCAPLCILNFLAKIYLLVDCNHSFIENPLVAEIFEQFFGNFWHPLTFIKEEMF